MPQVDDDLGGTKCLAGGHGQHMLEMLLPDLKHYKIRLNFPPRGRVKYLGERDVTTTSFWENNPVPLPALCI